jgi:hypothetical protein
VQRKRILRTRLMASSRAFLSSLRLALLTLTTSRSLEGVGVMGNRERGGGVGVESEGESIAAAREFPLTPFLPRAILILK